MHQDSEPIPRNTLIMVLSWFWVVLLAGWSVFAAMATNAYMEIVVSAGMSLPILAIAFIHGRYLWGLLLIPALALARHASRQQYTRRTQRRIKFALAGLIIVSTGLIILWFVAMHYAFFCLPSAID